VSRTITVQPFLASLAPARATTPFVMALPVVPSQNGNSPWSPRTTPAAAPTIDVEAIRREAIASGRDEGLRETAALRAQLQRAIDALTDATVKAAATQAAAIADAATAVVGAWLGAAPSFKPLVEAWLAKCTEPAQAHVHPSSAAQLRAAIGDAAIAIVEDPRIAPGDLALRSHTLELDHRWADRLAALRIAIQTQLEAG